MPVRSGLKLERATIGRGGVEVGVGQHDIGFLPPSSSCTRRPMPIAAWIFGPVAFEPVKVTASTRVVGHEMRAGGEAVHDVEHSGRQAGIDERGGEALAHQRCHRRRFEHNGVACC